MDFDLYLTLLQDRGDVYVDMYMDGVAINFGKEGFRFRK